MKEKSSKKIKENAFYEPLKSFFLVLGIYVAVLLLREPFNITDYIIDIITKVFKIIVILTTAIGLANSITTKSMWIEILKEKSTKDLDKSTLKVLVRAIKILIYFCAGFLIITELGYNINGLITGLGISSVVITLAAQDAAKNLIGGLTVVLDKPFKIGDYIKFGDSEGKVEDISFRSVRVRTSDNSVLYIPNSQLSVTSLINCSQRNKNRYKHEIVLPLDTSISKIEKVKEGLQLMFFQIENIIKDTINIQVSDISKDGIKILVDCYVDTVKESEFASVKEEISYKIMQVLEKENITLA